MAARRGENPACPLRFDFAQARPGLLATTTRIALPALWRSGDRLAALRPANNTADSALRLLAVLQYCLRWRALAQGLCEVLLAALS